MIQLEQGGSKAGIQLSAYNAFIQAAMDYKIYPLIDIIPEIGPMLSGNSLPSKQELKKQNIDTDLKAALDKRLSQLQVQKDKKQKDSAILAGFAPFSQIFRIQRDFLFNTANRQDRLLAGIRQQLIKANENKYYNEVYL